MGLPGPAAGILPLAIQQRDLVLRIVECGCSRTSSLKTATTCLKPVPEVLLQGI